MLLRLGSFTIFLLLDDSSHDAHFSTRQNMKPGDFLEKKFTFFSSRVFQIFDSKHGSSGNYSDLFCFSCSRSRAMRSPRHNSLKILINWNEILQTCSGVNVVVRNTFWVHSVQGFRS